MTDKALQTQSAVTPMQLLQVAMDKGADLDKLEKLMDLQIKYEANESRKLFNEAISVFKAKNIHIVKECTVSFSGTSYKHASLGNIISQVTDAMSECGLTHCWSVDQDGSNITVTCNLGHVSGHSQPVSITAEPDDSGKKNKIQQVASTITYLQRYTLLSSLGLATHDNDAKTAEVHVVVISETQWQNLDILIEEVHANVRGFCTAYGIDAVENLPASQYDHAIKSLEKKRKS